MIIVKLSTPLFGMPQEVLANIVKQTPSCLGRWEGIQFHANTDIESCDFYIVFEGLEKKEKVLCPPQNTVFVAAEPSSLKRYDESFLAQFATIITCQRGMKHGNKYYNQPGHTWFIKKNYDELMRTASVQKNKLLSIVTSNKQESEGHKKRYEFCLKLKEYFGDAADLYGRGINEFEDKWDVLAPYKYSVAIENYIEPDWITEKIGDCFLAHTFPFYYGAPNVLKYYREESFVTIDIDNFALSSRKIEEVVADEFHYENSLQALLDSKTRYLNNVSLVPMLHNFIIGCICKEKQHKEPMVFYPEKSKAFLFFKKMFKHRSN